MVEVGYAEPAKDRHIYMYSTNLCDFLFFLIITVTFQLLGKPQRAPGQAVITGVYPFPPPVRAFISCRSKGSAFPLLVDFHRMQLTHALALSALIIFI